MGKNDLSMKFKRNILCFFFVFGIFLITCFFKYAETQTNSDEDYKLFVTLCKKPWEASEVIKTLDSKSQKKFTYFIDSLEKRLLKRLEKKKYKTIDGGFYLYSDIIGDSNNEIFDENVFNELDTVGKIQFIKDLCYLAGNCFTYITDDCSLVRIYVKRGWPPASKIESITIQFKPDYKSVGQLFTYFEEKDLGDYLYAPFDSITSQPINIIYYFTSFTFIGMFIVNLAIGIVILLVVQMLMDIIYLILQNKKIGGGLYRLISIDAKNAMELEYEGITIYLLRSYFKFSRYKLIVLCICGIILLGGIDMLYALLIKFDDYFGTGCTYYIGCTLGLE